MLSIVQQVERDHGQGSLLGHTLTWQGESASGQRSLMVVVAARDGETSVRIEERLHGLAGALFGGMVGGGGIGAGVGIGMGIGLDLLGSVLLAATFPVGMVGLSYVAARSIFRNRLEARRRFLTELLDRIVREATASMATARAGEMEEGPAAKALPTPARPTSTRGR